VYFSAANPVCIGGNTGTNRRAKGSDSQMMRWFMARLIKFYRPPGFSPAIQTLPADHKGKLIQFPITKIKKLA
jgi:hypothetical protein